MPQSVRHGSLGGRALYALLFSAWAAKVDVVFQVFDEPLVEIMANPFTLCAYEVDSIDAFVDFFPIQHTALEFLQANPQQLLVVFLDPKPPNLIGS